MAKLLFASVDFLPQIGGVSLASHHIANAFARLGHDVTVLAGADAAIPPGLQAEYRLVPDANARPRAREGCEWVREELPRLTNLVGDLWRAHGFDRAVALHPFYYGPALQHAAVKAGRPFSVMFHGFELRSQLLHDERVRMWKAILKGCAPTLRQVTMDLVRTADEILVNSSYTAGVVKRTGTRVPVVVTGCGIDEREARRQFAMDEAASASARAAARDMLGVAAHEFLLGAMCRLVPTKNVTVMIDAVARTPDAKGLIIGDGPERKTLEARAAQDDVKGRIIFKSFVCEEEKWRLLRALDAFSLLAREGDRGQVEGFGIVLLEAAAAGAPVIAARSGGMVDVVKDGETGLMTSVNADEEVAAAIARLRHDEALRRRVVAGARRQIETKYNWTAIATRLSNGWKLQHSPAPAREAVFS